MGVLLNSSERELYFRFIIFCECFACILVCIMCGFVLTEIRSYHLIPAVEVTGSCEPPPCGCWESNVSPLQEQQVLQPQDNSVCPL